MQDHYGHDIPAGPGPWNSLADIVAANEAIGNFWFSDDTLEFFRCIYGGKLGGVIGGRFFVTGERGPHQSRHFYSVRVANDDGSISTLGEFQDYSTPGAARKAAVEAAEQLLAEALADPGVCGLCGLRTPAPGATACSTCA